MKIKSGSLIFLNLFDIGGEVRLEDIKDELEKFGKISSEFDEPYTKYWIELGKLSLKITVDEETEIKIYPVGTILVRSRIKIENKSFGEVIDIIKERENVIKENAKLTAEKISESLEKEIYNKYEKHDISESYKIVEVNEFEKKGLDGKTIRPLEILANKNKIAMLLGEEKSFECMSKEDIDESLRLRHSFSGGDAIVVGWSTALVYCNPLVFGNILHMLELAKMQLLELRIYDMLLDSMMKEAQQILNSVGTPFVSRKLSEKISITSSMRIEIISVIQDVMNIAKVAKDRVSMEVYELASERFAIDYWFSVVNNKIEKLNDIYKDAYEKMGTARNISLEWMIVVLIIIEIILFIGIEIIDVITS